VLTPQEVSQLAAQTDWNLTTPPAAGQSPSIRAFWKDLTTALGKELAETTAPDDEAARAYRSEGAEAATRWALLLLARPGLDSPTMTPCLAIWSFDHQGVPQQRLGLCGPETSLDQAAAWMSCWLRRLGARSLEHRHDVAWFVSTGGSQGGPGPWHPLDRLPPHQPQHPESEALWTLACAGRLALTDDGIPCPQLPNRAEQQAKRPRLPTAQVEKILAETKDQQEQLVPLEDDQTCRILNKALLVLGWISVFAFLPAWIFAPVYAGRFFYARLDPSVPKDILIFSFAMPLIYGLLNLWMIWSLHVKSDDESLDCSLASIA